MDNPGDQYSYQAENEPMYRGPNGYIKWTNDGRVNPSSNGDSNEANEVINFGTNKYNEIVKRYKSGQKFK